MNKSSRLVLALGLALPFALLVDSSLAGAASSRPPAKDKEKKEEGPLQSSTFAGLALRPLGPALTSGRVADLAVDPTDARVWWLGIASGGVWKTENAGTTWSPVFDGEASFSIGALAIDPKNPNVVWVGTGENNNQRSVAYGDGVYRTLDGGKSWKRMGLEKSEHIGKILIDPRDSDVVWVAAYGPLWSSGGERGVYRTGDGGATWTRVLDVGPDTGVADLVLDPRDPDTLLAAAHQRRRHVWTYVSGGPGSALHKTTDGGKSWRKIESGLPKGDKGRIGLAFSPVAPEVVYAVVEAEEDQGGFFRSSDRGESWEKRSDHATSGNYYVEIIADPHQLDRVYSMDTFLQVTDDGGKTFRRLGQKSMHVDHHAMWIDPRDPDHYLTGCDGGLYETFDRGATWRFFENLPVTQFYRVNVDNSSPVYQVCGGTQDNNSMCGPSRTLRHQGPSNEDWTITQGGDGFWTAADPTDPNIVYAEAQYGVLTRYDRRSGENVDIQPQPGAGEPPLRWNWDAPMILSPHSPTRLYFAANRLFRSDDRGDSWTAVSPDLTRQLDRNQLPVFGRVQRPEAVARGASTSLYGNIVSLAESPVVEGLLYAGTDDGLIQVSEDAGVNWRRVASFPGVPELAYVSRLVASRHDADTVYAAFDHHKMGDFRPYVLKSGDRGRTWTRIASNLPERGTVYALAEDPVDRELLFAGTEFALFFSPDGGGKWIELEGGLPTIQVRDLVIQEREADLVVATFGRGFYVLDDLSALREIDTASLGQEALLFPVRKAPLHVPASRIGDREKGFLGETWYMAPNPPAGALFTWYLRDEWKTTKKQRQEAEKKALEGDEEIEFPSFDALRAESRQEEARLVFTVRNAAGEVVRRLEAKPEKGIHRLAWDLRHPAANPVRKQEGPPNPWLPPAAGPLVAPGRYTVSLELVDNGRARSLAAPRDFDVEVVGAATLAARDRAAVLAFQGRTARLQRAVLGAEQLVAELKGRLELLRRAIPGAPALDLAADARARELQLALEEIEIALSGDRFLRAREENTPPSISERVQNVVYSSWYSTSAPTRTQADAYRIAGEAFERELARLREIVNVRLPALEQELERAGAPWTTGRLPDWRLEP
ncbi:MAG: glycosyl hydrolase [Thermoanaerobaculia bacterium]|nr:MAG: glycosyl hydrolase [Thermoanaerobaculia bacterium]